MPLRVAMIGCGLIGQKRLNALPPGSVTVACDLNLDRAKKLAALSPGCRATDSVAQAVAAPGVDVVMVATLNSSLAPIAAQAIKAGKHVLVEKPGGDQRGRNGATGGAGEKTQVLVRVGYNHRYHPAGLKALELSEAARSARSCLCAGVTGRADASATKRNGARTRNFPAAAN